MRYVTRTERVGERLGDIDWDFDWQVNGRDYSEHEGVAMLRQIEAAVKAGRRIQASTYGGWPRIWQDVLDVGMWDGWPFWRPMPSVLMRSPLGGGEWHWFGALTGVDEPAADELGGAR